MKKVDTSAMTICFPVRIDSDFRLRNLEAALRYYSRVTTSRIIVLEADDSPKADKVAGRFAAETYRFVADGKPIFHRTHYINEMLRMADTRLAAVADTDIIVPRAQILAAYNAVYDSETEVMAIPYDGIAWSINEYYSDVFCRRGDIRLFTKFTAPRNSLFSFNSVGGFFVVEIERYRRCGWENEYFAGWGPEDAERHHRLTILGCDPVIIPGVIYHLYHSRGINSGSEDMALALATKREYCKVCAMWPDELRSYISTWPWI